MSSTDGLISGKTTTFNWSYVVVWIPTYKETGQLRCMYTNADSLLGKRDLLKVEIENEKPRYSHYMLLNTYKNDCSKPILQVFQNVEWNCNARPNDLSHLSPVNLLDKPVKTI